MSSWMRYGTKINCPSMEVLQQACSAIVKLHNGQLVTQIVKYGGEKQAVELGFKFQGIDRGIGLKVENGELVFICDNWGNEQEYTNAQKEYIKLFKALALKVAMENIGYSVDINELEEKIVMMGS